MNDDTIGGLWSIDIGDFARIARYLRQYEDEGAGILKRKRTGDYNVYG